MLGIKMITSRILIVLRCKYYNRSKSKKYMDSKILSNVNVVPVIFMIHRLKSMHFVFPDQTRDQITLKITRLEVAFDYKLM